VDLTTALTGMLPAIVLLSMVFTAIVSIALLRRYRLAVVRSMSASSASTPAITQSDTSVVPLESSRLAVTTVGVEDAVYEEGLAAYQATSGSLRRLGMVYTVAGLCYALILSLPWLLTAEGGFSLMRLLWLFVCYLWPAIVTLLLVFATTARQKTIIVGVYFGFVAVMGSVALARNPDLDPGQLIFFWSFANVAGTLLLSFFLARKIRAVGPLVLAFMVLGVTGAFLVVTIAGSNDALLYAIVELGGALGLGATALFLLLQLLGFSLFGLFGWWLLSWLGRAYRAKLMSDQSLTVDALWLLFAVLQSITLAFEGWAWIFAGVVAFVAYKAITSFGFARISARSNAKKDGHRSLLLLRVFALGRRSERLFDGVSKRWRCAGSIDLIAGPDLVTSTVEPHEFLDYLGGRLSRQFIESEADLDKRMAQRDLHPDPDGRYRVNEFFCRQNTWQVTMRRLSMGSDVVLMDLRSFSPANQGCLWELEQLLNGISLERVLFVIDQTTDQPFLRNKLQELWERVPVDSPSRAVAVPEVRLFLAPPAIAQAVEALAKRLFAACVTRSA
jgi:hypothetical protein